MQHWNYKSLYYFCRRSYFTYLIKMILPKISIHRNNYDDDRDDVKDDDDNKIKMKLEIKKITWCLWLCLYLADCNYSDNDKSKILITSDDYMRMMTIARSIVNPTWKLLWWQRNKWLTSTNDPITNKARFTLTFIGTNSVNTDCILVTISNLLTTLIDIWKQVLPH